MNLKSPLSHRDREPESGVLYLVGTPIGNLEDISIRALKILKKVSLIACEDTRQTKKILNKFSIKNELIIFNKHNSSSKIPAIINELKKGKSIGLVSDAGMPSICDPGEELVNQARLNEIDTICIPGPCAVTTAIVSSGFPSSRFVFEGFLPKKKTDRDKIIYEIGKREQTTVIFESPHRLIKLLKEFKECLGGEREIEISRELTKKFEEHIREDINAALDLFEGKEVLGEITMVIKGIDKKKCSPEIDKVLLKKELDELIKAGISLSSASKYLAKKNSCKKNEIYKLY
tara:strand:+ start:3005 stop:3871 length:867 start_codon:yes stop_codon:yes gene_type:complete